MAALLILWFIGAVGNGIAAPIIGTLRRGLKGFGFGCAVAAGWIGSGCLLMAAIAVLERSWSVVGFQMLLSVLVGVAGILTVWWGWRQILQPRFGPGQCAGCGYPLVGLRDCPECGLREAATQTPVVD